MNRNIDTQRSTDWIAVILFALIALTGLFTIFSATYKDADASLSFFELILKTQYGKQALWVTVGIIVAFIIYNIESRIIEALSSPSYLITILLIIATIIIAVGTKGADAWINIGSFKLQPSEFMKITTCLLLAKHLSRHDFSANNTMDVMLSCIIIIVPMLLIIYQKDTGSALVFLFLFFVLFRAGVISGSLIAILATTGIIAILSLRMGAIPTIAIIWGIAIVFLALLKQWYVLKVFSIITVVAVLILLITNLTLFRPHGFDVWTISSESEGKESDHYFLLAILIQGLILILPVIIIGVIYKIKKQSQVVFIAFLLVGCTAVSLVSQTIINYIPNHQQKRIHLFLGMINDPHGIGWDPHQIEIAIGSGGLFGKGFRQSTQVKNKFISEESTDFIFCTIGEEQGFVGSTIVVLLYLALLIRIIVMAERKRSRFSLFYGYGLALILFSHILINLFMQLKMLPIIGIPLPLISYGGSSCIAFTILFFIFIRLDSERQKFLN